MSDLKRSGCPISLSLELVGDRWTLLIIRDMVFAGKTHFRQFLQSDEGISSRTLADRLQSLQAAGIVTRHDDPGHKLKAVYRLTRAGIDLVPVLVDLGAWGNRYCAPDRELGLMAQRLSDGGAETIEQLKKRLAAEHLGES